MSSSAVRCSTARSLPFVVLLALSCEVGAQSDVRDDIIEQLRQRTEALEKELAQRRAAPPAPSADAPKPEAPKPEARKPEAPAPSESEEAGAADEGARALERALVREGGLVLPRRVIEVEPRFEYVYRGVQGLNVVTVNGLPQAAQQDRRSDKAEASVAIRAGLPKSFQVEARLPYVWLDQNRATSSVVSESERVSGWGDIELGVSKQVATARRGGVLGSLLWKTATGEHELGRLSPGSGFPSLQAALTVVTREDPLVFFLSPSYTWVYERDRNGVVVDPGDAIGLKAGTLLAASPETSLRTSFELSRAARTRIDGQHVAGSDTMIGILELGVAKTLTRRTLLDVQLGIGITPDAPDFRIRLAVPIRFGP
jgi:hypothetical protein